MKKRISVLLIFTMVLALACSGLAEPNLAKKNANLYRQETFYEKDFRSYDTGAFDLTALPDYERVA